MAISPGLTECPECNSPNVTVEGDRLTWCVHHGSGIGPHGTLSGPRDFVGQVKIQCRDCGFWTFRQSGYEAKKALETELTGRSARDGQELLELLPLAARLRVIGGSPRPYRRLIESANGHQKGFNTLLVERAEEGIHDLNAALGDFLGMSVIEAQDFFIALSLEYGRAVDPWETGEIMSAPPACAIPAQARKALMSWASKTLDVTFDPESGRFVKWYLERYPLPEWVRLPVTTCPYMSGLVEWIRGNSR